MTIYYTTGTVTVTNNSTAVTGSGTAWLTNGIRAGDWLIVRNQIAVIATVTSNTALTLETAWVPATASVSAYAIARVDDGVRALQSTNDLLAAFNAGPAQGRFGDGSAATPAVAFTSQTNTGLFRPATSVLALSVNGTERARLTTTGMQVTGTITGTAVTSDSSDSTSGRLVRVNDGDGRYVRTGTANQTIAGTKTFSGINYLSRPSDFGPLYITFSGFRSLASFPQRAVLVSMLHRMGIGPPTERGNLILPTVWQAQRRLGFFLRGKSSSEPKRQSRMEAQYQSRRE
jgi:hypothetical protein